MSASDHLSGHQFYHGTTARLEPGDWITSARNRGANSPNAREGGKSPYNYFTSNPGEAKFYADDFRHGFHDEGYVYTVQPSAPSEADPHHSPEHGNRRSRGPLLVTGVHQQFPSFASQLDYEVEG